MEWIEHPLLMLELRGSNPGHSISINTTSLPRNPRGSPRSRALPQISKWSERGGVKQKLLSYPEWMVGLVQFEGVDGLIAGCHGK